MAYGAAISFIATIDFLQNLPNTVHLILLFASILGITLIPFFSKNKTLLIVTLLIDFCSCMLDQNRWHPIEYQCFLTILFLYLYNNNPKQFINYFSFLVVVIYINSGLHKLNGGFLFQVWDGMILQRFFGFEAHQIQKSWIHYSGLLLGLIEMGSDLGLLFLKQKKTFALLLFGMHLFILLLISPIGLNYNPIVWPWNIVMIVFIYVLFYKESNNQIVFQDLVKGYNTIFFIVIGILPFFCLIGYFDNFLSFNLYSGSLKQLDICIENESEAKAYEPFFTTKFTCCKTNKVINTNVWGLKEMNIVVYPEERIFFDVMRQWKAKNPNTNATFCIYQYPYTPEFVKYYK